MLSPEISAGSTARNDVQLRTDLVEVRWHGRGGQGVVTAGELLAEAALIEGKDFQSFPEFSAERSGAPVTAFTRISSSSIDIQSAVVEPDIVVVLDPTLLEMTNVLTGLKPGTGIAVVNSILAPEELQKTDPLGCYIICTVDATGIAMDLLDRNLPNMPMLGALIRITGLVSLDDMERCIDQRLTARIPPSEVAANKTALKRGYEQARMAGPIPEPWEDQPSEDRVARPDSAAHLEGWQSLPIGGFAVDAGSSSKTQTGAWRSNVPVLDLEKCTHCMLCWLFCPDDSVVVQDLKVQGFDLLHCKGCGICALECPLNAIVMEEQTPVELP